MRKLVIDKAAVKHNLSVIKERAAGTVIYGVLTGDGGGAGVVPMARLLRAEGIGRFAVCEVKEAEALRQAGFEDEELLMLRSTTDREELERLVDLNVVCSISSVDTGLALNALAENRSTVVEAHIQVDTGMGFGGFLVGEPEKILLAYRSLPNVALAGIYTQLHAARVNDPETEQQLSQFAQVLDTIHKAGFETGMIHAAGSFALLHNESARMDGVRAGSAILGRCRRTRDDGLTTVGLGRSPWPRSAGCPRDTRWVRISLSSSAGPLGWRCCRWDTRTASGWSAPGRPDCGPRCGSGGAVREGPSGWAGTGSASWVPWVPPKFCWMSPASSAPPGIWPSLRSTPSSPGVLFGSTVKFQRACLVRPSKSEVFSDVQPPFLPAAALRRRYQRVQRRPRLP